jgi:general secretion pathway protein E
MLMGVSKPPQMQAIPTGCDACDLTGYQGRIGIYELLVANEPIRNAVREAGGGDDEIRALARRGGMKLMHEYALERVQEGLTTMDELTRVVPFEMEKPALQGVLG